MLYALQEIWAHARDELLRVRAVVQVAVAGDSSCYTEAHKTRFLQVFVVALHRHLDLMRRFCVGLLLL